MNTPKSRGFTYERCPGSGQKPRHLPGEFGYQGVPCKVCGNYFRLTKSGTMRSHGDWGLQR